MIYLELFFSFFQIGLLGFGGGMASIPLIQNQVVTLHNWLSLSEFVDLIAISEMTPGPIAINTATFVGTRIAGVPGALVATFGCVLPSSAIALLLGWMYSKHGNLKCIKGILGGLRPAVVSLIAVAGLAIFKQMIFADVGTELFLNRLNWIGILVFLTAFFAIRRWRLNPILVMLGCGVVGGIVYSAVVYSTG